MHLLFLFVLAEKDKHHRADARPEEQLVKETEMPHQLHMPNQMLKISAKLGHSYT